MQQGDILVFHSLYIHCQVDLTGLHGQLKEFSCYFWCRQNKTLSITKLQKRKKRATFFAVGVYNKLCSILLEKKETIILK